MEDRHLGGAGEYGPPAKKGPMKKKPVARPKGKRGKGKC